MFARFRNLFSKNKTETSAEDNPEPNSEAGTVTVTGNANGISEQNVDQSKLEGLNFLKSLVETEQQMSKAKAVENSCENSCEKAANGSITSQTQEVEQLLNRKLSIENDENSRKNSELYSPENANSNGVNNAQPINSILLDSGNVLKEMENKVRITQKETSVVQPLISNETEFKINDSFAISNKINEPEINRDIIENITTLSPHVNCNDSETLPKRESDCVNNKNVPTNTNKTDGVPETELKSHENGSGCKELSSINVKDTATLPKSETETDSVSDLLKKMRTEVMTLNYMTKETSPLPLDPDVTDNAKTEQVTNVEISKSSIINSWIQENNANFIPPTPYPLLSTESATKLDTNSSIVVEDLPSEVTTPSPTVDGSISGSSSNTTSTIDTTSTRLAADPTKIVVNPIGDNGLACNAINGKLTDIAEVAESLDTVIRDIQENSQSVEVESNPSPRDKKMGTLRSTSIEDWHSRSTEDESFATASEGRTSSFMSCNKSSCDYSEEGDDSTVNFEMPDVNSPFNMSFDESEHSYRSVNQRDSNKTPTKLSENGDLPLGDTEVPSTMANLEDLHSESVTPTPAENVEYYVDSIPIESETELEVAAIANAPRTNVLNESTTLPISVTPEVSSCDKREMLDANATPPANGLHTTNTYNNKPPPNVAWRRSKYYENITKQTIKGFL